MRQISADEIDSLRKRLAVQTATTRVLAETVSLGEAVPRLLAEIGKELNWAVAEFWEPAPAGDVLQRTAAWHAGDADAEAFVLGSQEYSFAPGSGLPGVVWRTREPEVVEDIAQISVPRRQLAARCNLHGALAFPVQVSDYFFGVLEFFATHPQRPDPELVATMRTVGLQLGQFIQRTRTEAARLESETRFRIFAETASDAMFTIDENSIIIYANPVVDRLFGYAPEELVGKALTIIIPQRMRAAHEEGIRRYRKTGKRNIPWSGVELPGLHKQGHEIPLEISFGEYVRDGTRYFTGIARDISERVRHQRESQDYAQRLTQLVQELEVRSREAEAASRAKSQFLANMSHELRTPINAIVGYGELLTMGVAGPVTGSQAEYLERVRVSAQHLLTLITDVLDLAKIEAGRLDVQARVASVHDDIEAALALVRPQAQSKSITLTAKHCAESNYIGDPDRVRQILINLLSNAVKFTDAGGRVSIECGSRHHRRGTPDPDGAQWLYVSIEDTGIGIDAEQLAAIFEPFVQASSGTTRTHGGSGLGLSISQNLARLMGGEITAESEPGKGSKFTLWIPRASDAA